MKVFGTGALIAMLLIVGITVAKQRPDFQDPSYFTAKSEVPISDRAVDYLAKNQIDGKVKIWVFFTDKGIFNKSEFTAAALTAKAGLTPRAKARREKHGVSEIRFIDLPVNGRYVDQLESMGAKVLSTSKWLNSASIEIDINRVGLITDLSFVNRVQPVATFKRPVEEVSFDKAIPQGDQQSLQPTSLLYGSSLRAVDANQCSDVPRFRLRRTRNANLCIRYRIPQESQFLCASIYRWPRHCGTRFRFQ